MKIAKPLYFMQCKVEIVNLRVDDKDWLGNRDHMTLSEGKVTVQWLFSPFFALELINFFLISHIFDTIYRINDDYEL